MANKQPIVEETLRPWIDPRDHGILWVLACSALLLMVCFWFYRGGHRGGLIEIERAAPLEAHYVVDINRADWPEIIQLPSLGEILAQRILADRHKNGPFLDVDDLVRVDGIGAKTLEKIRPFLLPIPKDTDWAAAETEDSISVQ